MSKKERLGNEHTDSDPADVLIGIGEEYAICEPAPKHTHMLFDVVRTMQREFEEYRYSSLERAQLAAEPFVRSVNKTMEESGLLAKPILMTGTEIQHPHADLNFATKTTLVAPRQQADHDDVAAHYDQDEVSGYFAGIWYAPRAVERMADADITVGELLDSDEEPYQYQIDLFYQVAVGGYRHMLGKNELYANSPVGRTTLEYYDDMHLRYVREALEVLLTVESPEVAMLVNELNVTLANPKRTAQTLRTVATLVRDLHATGSLRPGDSDALLNLVTSYINPHGMYDVEVPDALGYEDTEEGRVVELLAPADDSQPRYALQSSEVIFAEGYDRDEHDQEIVHFNPKGVLEPFFVFEDQQMIVHVPMRRIQKFKVLD